MIPALAKGLLLEENYAQIRELPVADLSPPSLAALKSTQALAELAQGGTQESAFLIEQAREIDPDSVEVQLAEARIMFSLGDNVGALANLGNILSLAPGYGPAWSLQGDIHMVQGEAEAALDSFDKAIELQQFHPVDQLKRALVRVQMQDYTGASQDAQALLAESPGNPAGNYINGLILFQNRQYAEAIEPLSLAEPAWKQFPLVLYFLGSAQLLQNNVDTAAALAQRYLGIAPDSVDARKLLAMAYLKQGRYLAAQAIIRPVIDSEPDNVDALTLLANAYLGDGQTDKALGILQRVAELEPDSARAQIRLAAGLAGSGRELEASKYLESASAIDPELQQADIFLILNHVNLKDFDSAIAAALQYQQRHPSSVTAHNLLGRVYLHSGREAEARAAFETVLSLAPADPSANHNLARIEARHGDREAAKNRYQVILASHPNQLAALLQLALLEAQDKNEVKLQQYLQRAINAHPEVIEPRLYMGRYYLAKGMPQRLPPLFSDLDPVQRRSPEVLQLLALAQISDSAHLDAQYTLEELLTSTPETPQTHHLLAIAAAGNNDPARSKRELERALELDPDFVPSRVALARMALAAMSRSELESHLQILVQLAPESPDVVQLQAAAARAADDPAQARALALQAYETAPGTHTVLELALYMRLDGQADAALELLQGWVDEHPGDIPTALALADNLRAAGFTDRAQAQYKRVLQHQPDNLVALVNLAWHFRRINTPYALELSTRAQELAPDSPEVLDTLAMVRFHDQNYRLAERHIRRALVLEPGNPEMRYHSALILAAVGKNEEALTTLQKLADSDETFADREQALELLARLQQ